MGQAAAAQAHHPLANPTAPTAQEASQFRRVGQAASAPAHHSSPPLRRVGQAASAPAHHPPHEHEATRPPLPIAADSPADPAIGLLRRAAAAVRDALHGLAAQWQWFRDELFGREMSKPRRRRSPVPAVQPLEVRYLLSSISVAPTIPTASEYSTTAQQAEAGQFTITRTGDLMDSVEVSFTLTGSATNGTDYHDGTSMPVATSVFFMMGESSKTITIQPLNDALIEGNETVVLTLQSAAGYDIDPSAGSATITIADAPLPTVSVTATDADASEVVPSGQADNSGQFTITRTGDLSQSLTVNLSIGGTATNGTDYYDGTSMPISSTVEFLMGESSKTITVQPVADALVEGEESVVVSIEENSAYTVESGTATVAIADTPRIDFVNADGTTLWWDPALMQEVEIAHYTERVIPENLDPELLVADIDAESPDQSEIEYRLLDTGNGAATRFAVDAATGLVYTIARFDFEDQSEWELLIEAEDENGVVGHALIHVDIEDLNDAPIFDELSLTPMEIAPIATAGQAVATIWATDVDGPDALRYFLSPDDALAFSIDAETGVVYAANPSVLVPGATLDLPVFVTDGVDTTEDVLHIAVAAQTSTLSWVGAPFEWSIGDRAPQDDLVGSVMAIDSDNGPSPIIYGLSDPLGGTTFDVDSATGQIVVADSEFLQAGNRYELAVSATDGDTTIWTTVTIDVTEDNHAPEFTSESFGPWTIADNAELDSLVSAVTATDLEADQLKYSLGDWSGLFWIDELTGEIRIADPEGLRPGQRHDVTVTVSDGEFEDTASLTIEISNPANRPEFSENDYSFVVFENASVGTVVGAVSAQSPDSGATLTYSIVGGNDDDAFTIDSATGAISVAGSLDAEDYPSYLLTIAATDDSERDTTVLAWIEVCSVLLTPNVITLELQNDDDEAGDGVTTDPTLQGTVSDPNYGDYPIEVEFDLDGDGEPDASVAVQEDNTFSYSPGNLAPGNHTVFARATISPVTSPVPLTGEWVSLTFELHSMTAVGDTFELESASSPITLDVKANDLIPGGTATVTIINGPSHGTVEVDSATQSVTFLPDATFPEEDSFKYALADAGGNLSNVVTVLILQAATNRPPFFADKDAKKTSAYEFTIHSASPKGTVAGHVYAIDFDKHDQPDPVTGKPKLTVRILNEGSGKGIFAINEFGEITVPNAAALKTAAENAKGKPLEITVEAKDTRNATATAKVTIALTDVTNSTPTFGLKTGNVTPAITVLPTKNITRADLHLSLKDLTSPVKLAQKIDQLVKQAAGLTGDDYKESDISGIVYARTLSRDFTFGPATLVNPQTGLQEQNKLYTGIEKSKLHGFSGIVTGWNVDGVSRMADGGIDYSQVKVVSMAFTIVLDSPDRPKAVWVNYGKNQVLDLAHTVQTHESWHTDGFGLYPQFAAQSVTIPIDSRKIGFHQAALYAGKYLIEGVPSKQSIKGTIEESAPIREGDPVGAPLRVRWIALDPNADKDAKAVKHLAKSALQEYLIGSRASAAILDRGEWHTQGETSEDYSLNGTNKPY